MNSIKLMNDYIAIGILIYIDPNTTCLQIYVIGIV